RARVPRRLSVDQILAWADAHHAATGTWPTWESGLLTDAPFHLTWNAINNALSDGRLGLAPGSNVRRLLQEHRNVNNESGRTRALTVDQVLAWADAHHAATGAWPTWQSGSVPDAPIRLTWKAINHALSDGRLGLAPGSNVRRLLKEHRNVNN